MTAATLERPLSYEEERGKVMPSRNHGAIQANLIVEFYKNEQFRVYSELTLEFGAPYTPDISVYPKESLDLRHDQVRRQDPPLVAVEIFSPTQGYQSVLDKVEIYFANGVKSVWLVSPHLRMITIRTSDGREQSFQSGIAQCPVTGLKADLAIVFS